MTRYTCPHCKKPYYSAADPENMVDSSCPYCGLEEDEDETLQRTQTQRTT
jgi:uncharacterized Zn finger protein (UPF0148 family)